MARLNQVEPLTKRQEEVLEAALGLLVRGDGRLTMTAVAAAANCSKETLYKWFRDRSGLLNAIARWQASKVHVANLDESQLDLPALRARLVDFAADWLRVISGPNSLALNRLAIGQMGAGEPSLAAAVLQNGRFALAERMKPVPEAGRQAGLIGFDDAEEAFRTFFGLIARDAQIRLLLGDRLEMTEAGVRGEAERAAAQFLHLFPAQKNH